LQPSYNLVELAKKGIKLKIKRCPRCGGFIYWVYSTLCSPQEKELFRDMVKCFGCRRMFYLAKNGKHPKWVQFPDRNEEITIVVEDTVEDQLKKKGDRE